MEHDRQRYKVVKNWRMILKVLACHWPLGNFIHSIFKHFKLILCLSTLGKCKLGKVQTGGLQRGFGGDLPLCSPGRCFALGWQHLSLSSYYKFVYSKNVVYSHRTYI